MPKRTNQITELGVNYCIFCGREVFASVTAEVICSYCVQVMAAKVMLKDLEEKKKKHKRK